MANEFYVLFAGNAMRQLRRSAGHPVFAGAAPARLDRTAPRRRTSRGIVGAWLILGLTTGLTVVLGVL